MKERTMLLPQEVEMELSRARMEREIDEKHERIFVKEKVQDACNDCKSDEDKITLKIDPVYIHIPEWQRKCEIARAKSIGDGFIKHKWDLPKVIYWNGRLWCVDGMHRIYGSFLAKFDRITVDLITDITMKEAISIFLDQTTDRKKMTLVDMWGAALEAEVPEYVELKRICDENKVCVFGTEFDEDRHFGTFTSLRDGLKMAQTNPELLNDILAITTKLKWNGDKFTIGKAYGARAFRSLRKLFTYFSGNRVELERVLLENCSGASFWNENLESRTQAQMFDLLSNIIYKNMNLVVDFPEVKESKGNITYIGA